MSSVILLLTVITILLQIFCCKVHNDFIKPLVCYKIVSTRAENETIITQGQIDIDLSFMPKWRQLIVLGRNIKIIT